MKLIDPDTETHVIRLIPRINLTTDLVIKIKNEATKESFELNPTDVYISNGIMTIVISYLFEDKQKYEMKLMSRDTVVYRGNLITTKQNSQDYKLTNGLYYYE